MKSDLNKLARAQNRSFRLEFDTNYGIDRKTGWSVICDGHVIVQFAETPEEALKEAASYKSLEAREEAKLTFGDLTIGDHFISFPLPGDNDGHGGYLGGQIVFSKTLKRPSAGTAVNGKGTPSEFPNTMPVIKVLL